MSTLNSNTITSLASSDLLFSTSATERLRILTGGNIGIGTASPAEPLDVNGTVKSTGLYCTGNMGIGTTIPTAATVALQVNGTMKNTNPAFAVAISTTPNPIPNTKALSYDDLIFDSVNLNVGSCYNNTNGRFTAPVEGYYFFSASIFFHVRPGITAESGSWHFAKNAAKNHVISQSPYTPTTNYISYYTVSGTSIQHLNTGDYMNVKYVGSPYPAGYSQWNGFLIG
jgi:hypothetical protein